MSTKKQRRSENFKDRQKKKSIRTAYLVAIIAGVVLLLGLFFVILFKAIFPDVNPEAMNKKKIIAKIYFSDSQERSLVAEKRHVYKEADEVEQAKEIVKVLLDGPASKTGYIKTFPEKVSLRGLKLDKDGVAHVDFSDDLTESHPGGSAAEMATVYSLTNTLTASNPAIKAVKIFVQGKELPSIKGHISTVDPFKPDADLVASVKEGQN